MADQPANMVQPGGDIPAGEQDIQTMAWHHFSSPSRKLSFRYPSGWRIARHGSYLILSCEGGESHNRLVLDLTPIHLYPYSDISEYMDKTRGQTASTAETEIRSLPGGYQASRVHKAASSGREFNLFYIGKGNMAYSLTTDSHDLLETADQIIHSIRFQ